MAPKSLSSFGCENSSSRLRKIAWLLACATLVASRNVSFGEVSTNALSPEQELASFVMADERLTIELVAAEPEVVSPVAIAFDADGRLFVAEMTDYPNGPMSGRIKLLEDVDGDGRYEKVTVFAEGLPFPNGVLPWKGGVLVTAAPDIWYLKDTDGDGRADERRVLFTGFGKGNQQLRANGLTWGLDNWVYGANGRSEGEIRSPETPPTTVPLPRRSGFPLPSDGRGVRGEGSASEARPGVKPTSIRGHDFRFRPETGEFEAIAGRSQFGGGRDDWGNRFLSWNTIPVRHEVLAERYLNRNPHLAATESVADILEPGDSGRVFPLTPPPLTFNNESVKHFNALAGLTIYRGDVVGDQYRGNAFMGESLLNLVHRRVLEPEGVTFVAKRVEREKEFLASTDPWFHPVNFATGPDGALYVVDFYRRFVEHPDFVHGKGRDEVPWRAGAEHGRLWRIRNPNIKTQQPKPNLSQASAAELVKHLEDDNGWWRDTSQRLLVERQERAAIPALQELVAFPVAPPLARLHALYTLEGLRALTPEMLTAALKALHPGLREHACRLSESFFGGKLRTEGGLKVPDSEGQAEYLLSGVWPSSATASSARSKVVEGSFTNSRPSVAAPGDGRTPPKTYQAGSLPYYRGGPGERLIAAVLGLAEDPNARVRFQLALTLGELESNTKLPSLVRLAQRDFADRWQTLALLSSLGPRPWPFLKRLVRREPGWLAAPTVEQAGFLDQVARLVGSDHTEAELGECLVLLTQPAPAPPAAGRLALLAGLADGLARSRQPLRDLISHPPITLKEQMPPLTALFDMAATNAASSREKMPNRLLAIRILALGKPESGGKTLLDLLRPEQPGEIQSAAARALAELDDGDLAKALFAGWNQYAAPTRRRVLATVPRSVAETESLASALEEGRLSPVELEASIRQSLLKTPNDQLKRRFQNLLKTFSAPDREEVVLRFQPALQLEGDRPRGAVIFAKTCSVCHTVEGRGQPVGPDLSGIASRPKEALLVDILDPSRQVSADFINYSLVTTGGKSVSGFILSETAASMTLRRSGEPDETVLRSQISELRAEGKSLMPEGLEQGLGQQDMADLLSFLQRPEGRLLGN